MIVELNAYFCDFNLNLWALINSCQRACTLAQHSTLTVQVTNDNSVMATLLGNMKPLVLKALTATNACIIVLNIGLCRNCEYLFFVRRFGWHEFLLLFLFLFAPFSTMFGEGHSQLVVFPPAQLFASLNFLIASLQTFAGENLLLRLLLPPLPSFLKSQCFLLICRLKGFYLVPLHESQFFPSKIPAFPASFAGNNSHQRSNFLSKQHQCGNVMKLEKWVCSFIPL